MNEPTDREPREPPRNGEHLSPEVRHDLLEGELTGPEERAARRHLARCPDCREALGELEALRRGARSLPRELDPPRDLWPAIEARLRSEAAGSGGASPPGGGASPSDTEAWRGAGPSDPPPPARWGRVAGLAAAAALAGVIAGGLLLTAGEERVADRPPTTPDAPEASLVAEVRELETAYEPTIAELRELVDARELAPETRATLERNLAIIEDAIRESREAVEADPGGTSALENLRRMYDAKVEVLRMVAHQPPRP